MNRGPIEPASDQAAGSSSEQRELGARSRVHIPPGPAHDIVPPAPPLNGLAVDAVTGVTLERLRQEYEQSWYSELQLLAPTGYFLTGLDSTILQANVVGAGMLGVDRAGIDGVRLRDFVSVPFLDDFDKCISAAINTRNPCHCMLRLQDVAGAGSFHVTLRASADPGGQACRVVVVPAGGAQDALERAEERFRRMVHLSTEGMWELDARGITSFVNPRMAQMMGCAIEDMVGRERDTFMDEEGRQIMRSHQARRREGEQGQDECKFMRTDGSVLWVTMATMPIFGRDGSYAGSLALVVDITEQKKSADLAWRQANYDALTGLPNRHMFLDRLDNEARKVDRGEGFLALLFIDLDQFKQVNDELGHAMGDLLLVEAARRIGRAVRTSDTLSRLGGDEFTAILPGLHMVSAADRIAQAVIATLQQPFFINGHMACVSASVGIALYPDDARSTARLLECADQAMYASKKAGRNRYSYFTQDLQDAAMARLEVATSLREAVREHQFEVLYQPIVSLSTGELCKAEALLRWRHPRHGLLSPADFMPYAESSGMMLEIGDWAFREAARQAAEWRVLFGEGFQLSVNKSAVEFRRAWQLDQGWVAYLGELGLPPRSLLIEINESVLLDDASSIQDGLREYHNVGVQVALDDFGIGYSSMAHLNDVALDYIKIDPALVRRIEGDPAGLAMCQAIVAMARKLGLKVVAEGVETGAQRDLLHDAGCDFAQGYIFAPPMPAADVAAFGERRRLH